MPKNGLRNISKIQANLVLFVSRHNKPRVRRDLHIGPTVKNTDSREIDGRGRMEVSIFYDMKY